MPEKKKEQVLSVRDLDITFKTTAGPVHAIRGVNIDLYKGETVALVGESGSGKSVTMKAAMGILAKNATVNSGSIRFSYHHADGSPETVDLLQKDKKWIRRHINGKRIAMVFQDPMASLNPRKKVEDIIGEGLDIHHLCKTQAERREKVEKILAKVGLAPEHAERYPHQFSGGQRQRVGIARALIMNPKLIIADECISALDVSIQAQVVNLMKDIQQETGTAYLFIAHDLSMVKYISDRIGVLHLGHLLETGTTEEIFEHPIHPYTRSLLSAIPLPNPVVEKRRVAETYDYATSGIDYSKGTSHHVEGSHYVKCTDEEFAKWCK
ncbi:MAG: ABC transporter ATP-binding protein [Faecalibacterium prausnitzii]|nr:ABC transporter ATP-binding protein [Faecalibacterium prausnitzii]